MRYAVTLYLEEVNRDKTKKMIRSKIVSAETCEQALGLFYFETTMNSDTQNASLVLHAVLPINELEPTT